MDDKLTAAAILTHLKISGGYNQIEIEKKFADFLKRIDFLKEKAAGDQIMRLDW